jgi:hypothetical protein
MILGSDKAKVDDHLAQPLRSTVYRVEIHGEAYNLHDTVGLGERNGDVDSARAAGNLYRLVDDLSNAEGINLLVYVVRCNRRSVETMRKHYSLIHHGFCDSKVPIVIVVTGCETVGPTMDSWWSDREASFTAAGMLFNGHACLCAFKGLKTENGGYRNEDLFNHSMKVVRQLIVQRCMSNSWKKVWHLYSQFSRVRHSLKDFQCSNRFTHHNPFINLSQEPPRSPQSAGLPNEFVITAFIAYLLYKLCTNE